MPGLDRPRPGAREVDLAEVDEVRVGPLQHVHDLSALVHDLAKGDDLHPVDHVWAPTRSRLHLSESSSAPVSSMCSSQRSLVNRRSASISRSRPTLSKPRRSSVAPRDGVHSKLKE